MNFTAPERLQESYANTVTMQFCFMTNTAQCCCRRERASSCDHHIKEDSTANSPSRTVVNVFKEIHLFFTGKSPGLWTDGERRALAIQQVE